MAETEKTAPFTIIDWSTHPGVADALCEGKPLTEDQLRLLAILVDPRLDPYDDHTDARVDGLIGEWSTFEGADQSEIDALAYRLSMYHQQQTGDSDCWVFQYTDDVDTGWYEVGSYLPGTGLHVTRGEDGKYLHGPRYDLVGLRAAIHAAETIEYTWSSVRREMTERGLLPKRKTTTRFLVSWSVDDTDNSCSPEQAAARVWRDVFKRTVANSDDACVFEVTDNATGEITIVDLSENDLDELLKEGTN